ncbi:S41 family peptidase [Candidatus Parcubacteria bacterium]|nr:S41 family peptidase [Candidatus Parcubacteria bacterium]
MQQNRFAIAGALLAVLIAFGAGFYIRGSTSGQTAAAADSILGQDQPASDADLKQFWLAWNALRNNFVDTTPSTTVPTAEEKVYGAIQGLTESYKDPYTVFFPPVQAQQFQESISGAFEGVGMEIGVRDNVLTVIAPIKNSPAERAGILPGDMLVAIEGKSTEGQSVEDAVKIIRGKKGTTVKLTLVRKAGEPFEVSVMRDTIQLPIVETKLRDDGVFEVSIYTFSANSTELFRGALREFAQSGSKKLLLDLRGNPGGYLQAAVAMASFFLPVGDVVVSEDFEGKADPIYHRSLGYNTFPKDSIKMAILIDQGSASASEILAGALKAHGVAKLVGTRSFGKGSVQQLVDLGNGAQLKVTIARWLTPDGVSISNGGLTPDIQVDRTADDVKAKKDPQKDAAVKYLLEN